MRKSTLLLAMPALFLMACAADAAKICPPSAIGTNFVPLRTCGSDRCPQIMPLKADQEVTVVTPGKPWSELLAQNSSRALVKGFARSQFICP